MLFIRRKKERTNERTNLRKKLQTNQRRWLCQELQQGIHREVVESIAPKTEARSKQRGSSDLITLLQFEYALQYMWDSLLLPIPLYGIIQYSFSIHTRRKIPRMTRSSQSTDCSFAAMTCRSKKEIHKTKAIEGSIHTLLHNN